MYHYPPNTEESKKAYWAGIQKGRSIERKFCIAILLVGLIVLQVIKWITMVVEKANGLFN
jgi:hypothetical protein